MITHSRGGLTTRSFVEQVLPSSGWPATVDNIVFVASTNAGTHLADPERWSDLVDLYTNLAAVSAKVLTFAGAGAGRGGRGRCGQGHRGLREVPRLVRRRG